MKRGKIARQRNRKRSNQPASREARPARHPIFGAMKGMVRIAPGVDLTEPAEPDWEKLFFEANEWWIDPPKPPDSKS